MLQFCCFRRGPGLIDAAIRHITYSPYHHVALRFTHDATVEVPGRNRACGERADASGGHNAVIDFKAGEVVEAWTTGVRRTLSLNAHHTKGEIVDLFEYKIPLTHHEHQRAAQFLASQLGKKYDYLNVMRFVPGIRTLAPKPASKIWDRTHVYCSELAIETSREANRPLLERIPAWKIPPGLIPTSPLLRFVGSETLR